MRPGSKRESNKKRIKLPKQAIDIQLPKSKETHAQVRNISYLLCYNVVQREITFHDRFQGSPKATPQAAKRRRYRNKIPANAEPTTLGILDFSLIGVIMPGRLKHKRKARKGLLKSPPQILSLKAELCNLPPMMTHESVNSSPKEVWKSSAKIEIERRLRMSIQKARGRIFDA